VAKFKAALLIILLAVLVDFWLENKELSPMLRLFKFDLGQLPIFLLTYICLALGLIVGWLGHVLRLRKKRRQAAATAALAAAQEEQEPQQAQKDQQTSG
jgi:cell division protein FtsX